MSPPPPYLSPFPYTTLFRSALVVRARNGGQLECADVSRAHHVRASAEINEIAVAIKRNLLVRRDVFDDIEFVFARRGTLIESCKPAFFSEGERFVPRNLEPFEWMVGFDLLFHLRLDVLEILRRDAMRKIDIVIETVFHWRPCGELCFRPNF